MYVLDHIHVGPTFNGPSLEVSGSTLFSGGGTQPPKNPHAPVKKPKPKKKK